MEDHYEMLDKFQGTHLSKKKKKKKKKKKAASIVDIENGINPGAGRH